MDLALCGAKTSVSVVAVVTAACGVPTDLVVVLLALAEAVRST